ncbi:MAG: CsgG/HfaB family protein [Smithellaceae bacterium]|jgi:hypothetical protein|nr:CsgG/HfaB family protein [Smithellaceae bacterium]
MNAWKFRLVTVVLMFFLCGVASAAVRISPLPPPPPTAKLRVFVVAVTMEFKSAKGPAFWLVSPEEFDRKQKQGIDERLKQQGIYEVVGDSDIRAVLGDQTIASWEWLADDSRLAREAGRALHADYVLVSERGFAFHMEFNTRLFNLHSGQAFAAEGYVPNTMLWRMNNDQKMQAGREAVNIQLRRIFQEAGGDLMRTAIRKGKISAKAPAGPPKAEPPFPEDKRGDAGDLSAGKEPRTAQDPTAGVGAASLSRAQTGRAPNEKQQAFEKDLEQALNPKSPKKSGPRLIVYDFDAAEPMKVAGLILTEALREELYRTGGFVLVNRENILKIMDEYKLQQTSLIDEKQALKLGKWLAANEAVTGNLAVLGNTSVLQAKRTDIETLGTLAAASIKCPAGREDELLDRMPELAAKLISGKK